MTGLIDALISDPYLADAPQTLALRGSDNQRLITLTPLGATRFDRYKEDRTLARALDVFVDDDGTVWIAGIPRREDWERFQASLKDMGHSFLTSEDAGYSRRGTGGR
jgi:anaerobic ribonucleoside-triphosphate reductase activating protein